MKTLFLLPALTLLSINASAVDVWGSNWNEPVTTTPDNTPNKPQTQSAGTTTSNTGQPTSSNPAVSTNTDNKKNSSKGFNEASLKCIQDKNFMGNSDYCVGTTIAAAYGNNFNMNAVESFSTKDKIFECTYNSAANLDYEYCVKAAKAYNTILGSDQAMALASGVQSNAANKKIQNETTTKVQSGESLQTAALDATADKNKADAKILYQQSAYYGAVAAALTKYSVDWPKKISKVCSKKLDTGKQGTVDSILVAGAQSILKSPQNPATLTSGTITVVKDSKVQKEIIYSEQNCAALLKVVPERQLFANSGALSNIQAKIIEYTGKGAAAFANAKKLDANSEYAAKLADQYADAGGDAMFELCAIDPTNVKCKTSGTRVNQAGYTAGQFDLGGGGSGQAFNLNPNGATADELGNTGTSEGNKVAGVTSPFADEASEAAGLLDKVGGASYTSAGAGGGGGGVGGGGGGGSASLGSDLQGADKDNKEAEIKASKRDGGYGSGGGAGFAAMGGSRGDDENPLKSLFDGDEAKGGIEEDRSIASEDIDSSNSALFERISKRYSKVHGEKRIEANNLE